MADHRSQCRYGCNVWVWPDYEDLASLKAHHAQHEQGLIHQHSDPASCRSGAGVMYTVIEPAKPVPAGAALAGSSGPASPVG